MRPVFALFGILFFFIAGSSMGLDILALSEHTSHLSLDLQVLIIKLKAHKKLASLDNDKLIDFANIILESGLSYESIEPNLRRFLREKDLAFVALNKAIERQQNSSWRKAQYQELKDNPDEFSKLILKANLKERDREKALKVYAICINPFRMQSRVAKLKPTLCDPMDGYSRPLHEHQHIALRTEPSQHDKAQYFAYHTLVSAGRGVILDENLGDIDIFMMAKCMAETALRFWPPARHPFKAVQESYMLAHRSPEKAFFQEQGICSNFSGLSYNLSLALGFKSPLFLARRKTHVYLETQINGIWYHSHPFNSTNKSCDFIRFKP